jgi:hypothetical protein
MLLLHREASHPPTKWVCDTMHGIYVHWRHVRCVLMDDDAWWCMMMMKKWWCVSRGCVTQTHTHLTPAGRNDCTHTTHTMMYVIMCWLRFCNLAPSHHALDDWVRDRPGRHKKAQGTSLNLGAKMWTLCAHVFHKIITQSQWNPWQSLNSSRTAGTHNSQLYSLSKCKTPKK